MTKLLEEFRPALAVACPYCGAEPLQYCVYRVVNSGDLMEYTVHAQRLEDYRKARKAYKEGT